MSMTKAYLHYLRAITSDLTQKQLMGSRTYSC